MSTSMQHQQPHPYNTRMKSKNISNSTLTKQERQLMRKDTNTNLRNGDQTRMKANIPSRMSVMINTKRRTENNEIHATFSNKGVDFSKIRTIYPYKDENKPKRLYNLPEGKSFYPSWEEFKDPYKYIASISEEGSKYGIVKIIPPEGWKPSFSLNVDRFKFQTRKQKVNIMEGETRAKLNFIEQLQQFHAQQGRPFTRLPQLDKAPIDLYKLAKAVSNRGGPIEVSKNKQWAEVAREIKEGGYSQTCTSASKTIKERYYDFIDPYEKYVSEVRKECKRRGKSEEKRDNTWICGKCGNSTMGIVKEDMLHCSGGCDRTFHRECLNIKKNRLNSSIQWHCPMCLFLTGSDFGFEPGNTFTLDEFQEYADNFMQKHLKEHLNPVGVSKEDFIESEFWRIAHSMDDNTEVFYGADINSTDYGSGFPCNERDRNHPYANDPWNLRNLPRLTGSLLHDVTPAIPGMILPWVYVGMAKEALAGLISAPTGPPNPIDDDLKPGETKGGRCRGVCHRPAAKSVHRHLPTGISRRVQPREIKRHHVFSHERLLWDIAIKNHNNYGIVKWLKEPLKEIISKEIKLRADISASVNLPEPTYNFGEQNENELAVCEHCNGFAYLSMIKFKCNEKALCLEHANETSKCCTCGEKCCFLQVRVKDFHMRNLMEAFDNTLENGENTRRHIENTFEDKSPIPAAKFEIVYDMVKENGLEFEMTTSSQMFIDKSFSLYRKIIKYCYKIARNIFPKIYNEIPISQFNVTEFLIKWEKRCRRYQSTTDLPPSNEKHYCFCRRPDNYKTMIQCDNCSEWYHVECIQLNDKSVKNIEDWTCAMCAEGIENIAKKIKKLLIKLRKIIKASAEFDFAIRHGDRLVSIIGIIKQMIGRTEFEVRRLMGLGLAISWTNTTDPMEIE
ncbi:2762_t:CDS:2 [Diversispora eburnea]|uniref:2762_t:CDS:1 n=1 Tax=Diversispora eburnea TaxID=1213867 RepID=A0A9N8VBJ7_9GLOM|nr:2762_t:CDS:2 [Diversispora eburnea]